METAPQVKQNNQGTGTSPQWPYDDEFRNSLATVSGTGSRIWLYTKEVTGAFTNKRRLVAWFLIGLWVLGPWLTWDGQPLMLFNVLDRHFIILGQHFFPQDLVYFGILLLTFFLFVAVFTLTFGRVWCGWACPQTLFMEQFFRRVEYWIEGTARQQQLLDQAPWNWEKIWKKTSKHLIFYGFAMSIGLLVMFYVLGKHEVISWVAAGPLSNARNLIFLMAFSTLFYGTFSWAREQVCIAMCPYGRLQGVLMNNRSLAVIYDRLRGEPRRHKKKAEATLGANTVPAGDCIDCKLCVHVCPTGIDIRNGSQLECINCTACIDACDAVMDQVGKPRGLIDMSSHHHVENNMGKWKATRRTWIAVGIMVLLLGIDMALLLTRSPMTITLLRVPGQLYQKQEGGRISNLYNLQMVNKTNAPLKMKASIEGIEGAEIKLINGDLNIDPQGHKDVTMFISLPAGKFPAGKNKMVLQFQDQDGRQYERSTNFLAP